MKHRRLGFIACSLAVGTGLLVACGDDDAILLATNTDSGVDGSSANRTPSPDASNSASDASDSGDTSDAQDADAGEKNRDAQADVDIPPVDAGDPTTTDAGQLAEEFPGRLAAEMCRTLARCCFGAADTPPDGGVDGGRFDQGKCISLYSTNGLNQSNPVGAAGEKLQYDPAKASECLGRIRVLACNSNAAEYRALVASCYAVLKGTTEAGSSCATTGECKPGLFCNTATNGGTCEPIRVAGSDCGDWTTDLALGQVTCSNRYSGAPPRYCANLSDAGASLPPAEWKCADAHPLGGQCFNMTYCATGVCSTSPGPARFTCVDFTENFTAAACNTFIAK